MPEFASVHCLQPATLEHSNWRLLKNANISVVHRINAYRQKHSCRDNKLCTALMESKMYVKEWKAEEWSSSDERKTLVREWSDDYLVH